MCFSIANGCFTCHSLVKIILDVLTSFSDTNRKKEKNTWKRWSTRVLELLLKAGWHPETGLLLGKKLWELLMRGIFTVYKNKGTNNCMFLVFTKLCLWLIRNLKWVFFWFFKRICFQFHLCWASLKKQQIICLC